jgi:YVTN family beta-propeller protein
MAPGRWSAAAMVMVWVGALGIGEPAHAFLVQTVDGPNGPVQQAWDSGRDIPFVIHENGSDDLPSETVFRILRNSFRVWEEVTIADISFVDQGLTAELVPAETDGNNLVIFDEANRWLQAPRGSGIIAAAFVETETSSGKITDVDIIFNGRDFRFGTTGGASNTVDLGDVAIHEIGHLLGLDHTPLHDLPASSPTMIPFYSPVRGGGATLEADDRAGAGFLYPDRASQLDFGSISGEVTDIEGAPQFGVHVVAENTTNGDRIGSVTGATPGAGRGAFTIFGLTPGEYVVRIEPITGSINESNFGGVFRNFSTDFPTEYFGNVDDKDLSQPIVVMPGQRRSEVEFTTGFRRPGFPFLASVVHPSNTPDTQGPYIVRVEVADAEAVLMKYRTGGGVLREVQMRSIGEGVYESEIPGQPTGTEISYQVSAADGAGNTTFFPNGARFIDFQVVELSGSPLAFVALRDDDRIEIIDTGNQRQLARVEVGDEPIQVLLTRDGSKLFVSTLSSNEIAVLETSSFRLLDRIDVALQPLDMSLSGDGHTLFVSNSGAASITAIDVATHSTRVLSLNQIGRGPYGIAATETGSSIYVTDIGRAQVIVLDGTGRELQRIDVPAVPRSLALSPDGTRLYVTSLSAGELTVIGVPENEIVATVPLPAAAAFAVEPSPDGRKVYLTANEDGLLIVLDALRNEVVKTIQIGANPRDIAISPLGDRIFVTNAASNEIFVLDAQSDAVLEVYSASGTPRGIAIANPPVPTAIADVASVLPSAFTLLPNFPNPFNAQTLIRYSINPLQTAPIRVRLHVFNAVGQPVRALVDDLRSAGTHAIVWDGTDDDGDSVASGIYVAVFRGRGRQSSSKLMLLR